MPATDFKKYLLDARLWIAAFFIFRLYGITNPPLEGASTWRQCDGLMIARNFYEHDPNILYPRVDMAGDKTGIVGSEFPILNYLIYLLSLPFGFHDWFGRLIVLIVSSLGTLFFFKLIKRYYGDSTAFSATLLLLVSLWFPYSRITIPDTFSASLCIMSLYFGFKFLDEGKAGDFVPFFLLGLIGCLSKISAATLLTTLAIPMLSKSIRTDRKLYLTAGAAFILLSVCAWYFWWVPYLNTKYEYPGHFFMGQKISEGIKQLIDMWPRTLARFYETPLKYTGSAAFLLALYLVIKNKNRIQLLAFLIPFTAFFYIILVSGWGFVINSYYPLMFLPAMTFLIGCGLNYIKNKKIVYFILIVVGIEGIANQIHIFHIRDSMMHFTKLESILNSVESKQSDLIAINADFTSNPTPLYFAHRKGWTITQEMLSDANLIEYLKGKGCKHIVFVKDSFSADLPLQKVYESDDFLIYKI